MEHGEDHQRVRLNCKVGGVRKATKEHSPNAVAENSVPCGPRDDAVVCVPNLIEEAEAETLALSFVPCESRLDVEVGVRLRNEPVHAQGFLVARRRRTS